MEKNIITVWDIVHFIECNKKRAELEFRMALKDEEAKKEFLEIDKKQKEMQKTFQNSELTVVMPYEYIIRKLTDELKTANHEAIAESLRVKKGPLYEILAERGTMLKKNFENRFEIAKINLLILQFPCTIKVALQEILRAGKIDGNIGCTDEKKKELLCRLLYRIGIPVSYTPHTLTAPIGHANGVEIPVLLQNKRVWITEEKRDVVADLEKKLHNVSTKIQLRNAERQVKIFTQAEENDFSELQNEYLFLLKNLDAVLDDFNKEEKELVYKVLATYGPST